MIKYECNSCGRIIEKFKYRESNGKSGEFYVINGEPFYDTLEEETFDYTLSCVHCGADLAYTEKEAINILKGKRVKNSLVTPVYDDNSENQSLKKCPSCNAENLLRAKFCNKCGEKFDDVDKQVSA